MAGTKTGGLKLKASNLNMSVEAYQARIGNGEKYCWICKMWKPVTEYHKDKTRNDGYEAKCKTCRAPKVRKQPFIPSTKGRKHTPEARAKMSQSQKGNQNRKGKPSSDAHRANLSRIVTERGLRGEQHPRWKGGLSKVADKIRGSTEYKAWRREVYRRDHFTCQECGGNKGGTLVAHHIKPFADYPELRFDVANGITLCHDCHALKHPERKMQNLFKRKQTQD